MKPNPIITLALAASITSTTFAGFNAPFPEFKTPKQLAEWRAEIAAKAEPKTTATQDTAFYTGKPYLTSSSSYAFKFRSYNPELTRWTSEDRSGFPVGPNGITYSRNSPVNGIDSDGLIFLFFNGTSLTVQSGNGYQQGGSVDMGDVLHTWGAVSGPFGKGAMPDGWYSVTAGDPLHGTQRDTQNQDGTWKQGSMSAWLDPDNRALGNVEYKFNLDPIHNTDVGGRSDFRIHPDGPPAGTHGCVGISSYNDAVAAQNYINAHLSGLELYVE
jgi:RHS repeat-associated protein